MARAHVAIVEDDAPVRRALTRVLAAASFSVTAFESAEEFLLGGLEPAPDCVLVDVHLPIMNGLELRNHMAGLDSTACIVFITADHELARSEQQDPRTLWLTKPIDEETLIRAIACACSHQRH